MNFDLVAEDIACRRGGRLVFAGLSFRVPAGGALILRGANGSGKSSLLRLLAGLTPVAAGRLLWGETPVADDPAAHRGRIRYLGHLDGLKGAFSPRETLCFAAALHGCPVARDAAPVAQALAGFALEAVADWPAAWLSAGQRRRLGLARLLVAPAPLWLLDEPTSALDEDGARRLDAAIAEHRAAGGRLVVATHAALPLAGAQTLSLEDFAPPPGAAW